MSPSLRTAVVTGASKGIGAAIARRLAADGLQTVVNFSSDADAADAVVASITAAGGRAAAVRAAVDDADAFRTLFDEAEARFGPVDVLVNNAGVNCTSLIAETTDEDYRRVIETNITGAFNGMREGARRVRDGGRIISLSTSVVGWWQPATGVYAATKAAVEAMTHTLAKELGRRSVTVNAVAPGPVANAFFLAGRSPEMIARAVSAIPLGRLAEPHDIAPVVSFLAGPDSGWINGQVIRVNGGRN